MSAASGTKVEKFIGYRYPNGVFYAGPGQPMLSDPACAVAINLDAAWTPPSRLVLITRTTTPGTPTLEAVPLREGDVLQGPYVLVWNDGVRVRYWNQAPRCCWDATIEIATRYATFDDVIVAVRGVGTIHRLLTRPVAPVVTYAVQPLTEAVLALLGSPPSGASGS